jgi:hypothetical protein
MLNKTKDGSGFSKIDGCGHHPDILWESGNEPRRCFRIDVGCYSLLVFGRWALNW